MPEPINPHPTTPTRSIWHVRSHVTSIEARFCPIDGVRRQRAGASVGRVRRPAGRLSRCPRDGSSRVADAATPSRGSGSASRIRSGATYDGSGTNFALFSSVAEGVELCLFGDSTREARNDEVRVDVTEVDGHIWHVYLPEVRPGQHYGWRVHGPWDPEKGLWCNPTKLLIDPYAKAIDGFVDWMPACFGYDAADPDKPNLDDSAPHVPLAVVSDPFFDWGNDRSPHTAMHETVIYEAHVRGLTMRHPGVPERPARHVLGGRPSGRDRPPRPARRHRHRADAGAPVHPRPPPAPTRPAQLLGLQHDRLPGARTTATRRARVLSQAQEFKAMVKALHAAGIEVILDVVYNHTGEGNHLGPTLSMRGIDNPAYYRLVDGNQREYLDFTGTGNSMNVRHPHVLQLIMDSLRYWHLDMHVDGFRFDLASALARELYEVDRLSAFFDIVQQDPVISQVKLIAEPWDVGDGGYQVGNFPPRWSEWNGRYRDTIRDLWRGEPATLSEFGSRFTGSSDLYAAATRKPTASVNFVTCHDGFTLCDLVSYDEKHNEANGEANHDGESHNRSWNHGVEGPTDDPEINALRDRAAAQHDRHAAAVAGRADALRWRRARPHPARQQQRLLPGQRDLVVRLGRRRHRVPRVGAPAGRLPRRPPRVPPPALVPGPADPRHGRHGVVPLRRRRDDRRRLGERLRPLGRRVHERRRDPGHRPLRRADDRRHVLRRLQCQRARPAVDAARHDRRPGAGWSISTPPTRRTGTPTNRHARGGRRRRRST